ncbi:hypothetical protein L599_001400000510 [Luteimonas sp. J16]|jgi:outer membrane PBP1 activator LpoA protein|nr:hypothetical protein L599_001400000510 [Luteimonas sp. J16]
MRQKSKAMLGAALAAMLAGCASVQVGPQVATTAPEPVSSHWAFGADRAGPGDGDGYRPPRRLAVLLPMTGPLATAAGPVRDGLLAAYYGERRDRPELVFYDTGGTISGAVAARDRAVAEGADQILGPLGRDEVSALFSAPQPVPLLALNRGHQAPPENAADFSLAPEDEGAAIATRLLAHNARRVLVLSNGDDHAVRAVATFREAFEAAGGTIVSTLAITGEDPGDQSPALRTAATSEGGVDAVLVALRGSEARLVVPQLFAAGLGNRLRVATSQLASGTGNADDDRALDGVVFVTEPWTASGHPGLPSAATLAEQLPATRGPAARLFAFGHDAWLLSTRLPQLAARPDATIEGATGRLSMTGDGRVLRTPAWATFSGGLVTPVADTAR